MDSFRLVPKRTLDYLSEYMRNNLISWAEGWGVSAGNINVEAVASCEQAQISPTDEYHALTTQGSTLCLISKEDIEAWFFKLIFGCGRPPMDDTNEGVVFPSMVEEALLDILSGGSRKEAGNVALCEKEEVVPIFRKGSGAVFVVLSYEEVRAVLLMPSSICDELAGSLSQGDNTKKLDYVGVEELELSGDISVSASLTSTKLNIKDLLALSKGDLLVLDHKTDDSLKLYVSAKQMGEGRLGKSGGKKAVTLTN